MLLPIHSGRFRTAPPLNGTGPGNTSDNGSHDTGDRPVRPLDCITALLLFAAAVMLTLIAFGVDWDGAMPESSPLPYENTPVMVIPPHPR